MDADIAKFFSQVDSIKENYNCGFLTENEAVSQIITKGIDYLTINNK
jgi:hypothetical protein